MENITKQTQCNCEDPLLNIRALASYLHISYSTATKLSASRVMPVFKPSKRVVLYRKSDVDAWLAKNRIDRKITVKEMASEILFTTPKPKTHEN